MDLVDAEIALIVDPRSCRYGLDQSEATEIWRRGTVVAGFSGRAERTAGG